MAAKFDQLLTDIGPIEDFVLSEFVGNRVHSLRMQAKRGLTLDEIYIEALRDGILLERILTQWNGGDDNAA